MKNRLKVRRLPSTGLVVAMCVIAAACGNAATQQTNQVFSVAPGQEADDRTLEEKVDTDGDGEMSEDEIQTYARTVLLDFSDCMRNSGYPEFTDVVLEDFTEGGGGQGRFIALMAERGVTLPEAVPTLQSCGEGLGDLQTFAPQPSDDEVAEREALVLEFAACMRTTGVEDWPDPDFAANSGPNGYGPELLAAIDIQSDDVQEAIATCQAENSGVTIEQESDDEPASNPSDDEATEPSDDISRAPISPLIEGDTGDLNVAQVTRRDLVQTKSLAGTLGYGAQRPLPTNTTGIVTALPAEGDVIDFGEALFHIDNEPVLLFEGSIPQFRRFTSNMSDGADVEQLEHNLAQFGYGDDFDLTVDQDFTAVTRDVVEAFQLRLGTEETGRIELGRVVFSSTPVRIGEVHVELGQSVSPQITLVSVTDSEQRITMDLDAEDRSLVSAGTAVDIELPDGTVVAGSVSTVAAVATRSVNQQNGAADDPTIEVTVGFSGNPPDDIFDAAPVDIIVTDEVTAGVLTVPVPSLIALSGGGHAVELVVDGGTQLIAVELGDFVDEIVEVRGDLQEGDSVVLAAAG